MSPRRGLDPSGTRALFDAPVQASADSLRSGRRRDGRDALFSTGPPEVGTVLVTCSSCHARTRIGLGDIALRRASFSMYLPLLRGDHPHRIKCPACHQQTWCHIGWRD